ncbi:nitrilase-related carbon-nitrogen hydrolase [Caldisalinibacter kiritimatiensis]|uniref:Aliphatic amidase amiE n=1 Tax=Caldisalinibacter kiritimatiensis TaxID=1304284 RepID=R1AY37_9FIRM|nr:nitrilase-related carbon-nitrogen hydrolase [Caldisalinibacter kiritimatiensis]EOD01577.1 Aliphatic amidase amiE [Caldisalinibacter kiritimatiensis]
MKKPFKVAAIQFNPILNTYNDNIERLSQVIIEAAKNGAKLIVTPEMSTTGYQYEDRDAIKDLVDTIPGKTTDIFEKITEKYNCYIVAGMAEVDSETGLYYNSSVLVGPEGYIGKYRKIHQWETEEHWATWGDVGVPVFETELGNIAMNICMDSTYFESARLAAVNGADILAFSTNSSAQAVAVLQSRAVQNGLYIISANRSNTEIDFHMVGASAIWSPEGKKLAEAPFVPEGEDINESTIIYAEIDPVNYNNVNKKRLHERRPEIYKDLMLYISPWDYKKSKESKHVTASVLQYKPVIGDKDANMRKVKTLIKKAIKTQKNHIDLFVLPELSITGPITNKEDAYNLAEELDGQTVNFFKDLATKNNTHIVFGMIEKENKKFYNSAVLIAPNGEIKGVYKKTHLNEYDRKWAYPGNKINVFSTDIGKIGIMLGYDVAFPEVAGVMAVKRADIIVVPTTYNEDIDCRIEFNEELSINQYPKDSSVLLSSIALSTQAYTIVSNFIKEETDFSGRSGLYTIDPFYGLDKSIISSKEQEIPIVFEFDTIQSDWWFNQGKLISSRRTYFYKPLILENK